MNHTPTPYANPVKSLDGGKVIIDTEDGTIEVYGVNRVPTAQFVFRACNTYDELVEHLNSAHSFLCTLLTFEWDKNMRLNLEGQRDHLAKAIAKAEGK